MLYRSTRDRQKKIVTFTDVLLEGLAQDGGLYVPIEYPKITDDMHTRYRKLPYKDLAFKIIKQFVGTSISENDLKELIHKTYTKEVYGSDDITPVECLKNNLYLQDLSSGPSLAFKDMAMQFLGHIMDYELTRRGEALNIVGASSGDTVSAAEEAFRGKSQINMFMLTPKEGMSPFQKAQAGSVLEDNIFNISLKAPFDTCQDIVKEINKDLAFKSNFQIGAVNSINWGRICAQIVYYFKGYYAITSTNDEQIDVVVPSGNFGNVLAGFIAKLMGLNIRHLVVSTNENKVLDTFFKTGLYKQQEVMITSSPSMDISKASNIERLFFEILDKDAAQLKEKMEIFEATQVLDFSDKLNKIQNEYGFISGHSNHSQRCEVIKDIYKNTRRIIDPHTAAAVKVALDMNDQKVPILCMETAKPTKFEKTVKEALGFIPKRPDSFIGLEEKEQRFFDCDASSNSVKDFIRQSVEKNIKRRQK